MYHLLQVSADLPDRDSDLPFMPSRTHVEVLVGNQRALHPSAFVVATSEEGYDGDDRRAKDRHLVGQD
jgi:hypothetical protein